MKKCNAEICLKGQAKAYIKSLACDTANELAQHALERHAAAVRQLSNGTKGDDLYIRIATVGNTIQTVNSPMYDTYMSTPGNTVKLGAAHRVCCVQYLNIASIFTFTKQCALSKIFDVYKCTLIYELNNISYYKVVHT